MKQALGPVAILFTLGLLMIVTPAPSVAVEIDVDCSAGEDLEAKVARALAGQRGSQSPFGTRRGAQRTGHAEELTVRVRGECTGNLSFSGPFAVTVEGEGSDDTVISGRLDEGGDPVADVIRARGVRSLVVRDITLRRGEDCVDIFGASTPAVISESRIEDCETGLSFWSSLGLVADTEIRNSGEVGLSVDNGSDVAFTEGVIDAAGAAGAEATDYSRLIVQDSTVTVGGSAVGVDVSNSFVGIERCDVSSEGEPAIEIGFSQLLVEDSSVISSADFALLAQADSTVAIAESASSPPKPTRLEGAPSEPWIVGINGNSYLEVNGGHIAAGVLASGMSNVQLQGGTIAGDAGVNYMSSLALRDSSSGAGSVEGDLICENGGDAVINGGSLSGSTNCPAALGSAKAGPAAGNLGDRALPELPGIGAGRRPLSGPLPAPPVDLRPLNDQQGATTRSDAPLSSLRPRPRAR